MTRPDYNACDAILRQVCSARSVDPVRLVHAARATKAQLLVKGEAIFQMRAAGASWPIIARMMFYRHHSQAMHAMRAFAQGQPCKQETKP